MAGFAQGKKVTEALTKVGIVAAGWIWRWHPGTKGGVFPKHLALNGRWATDISTYDSLPQADVNGDYCECQLQTRWRDQRTGRFARNVPEQPVASPMPTSATERAILQARTFKTDREAADFLDTFKRTDLTRVEEMVAKDYSVSEFVTMNNALRFAEGDVSKIRGKLQRDTVEAFDRVFVEAPENFTVTRFTEFDEFALPDGTRKTLREMSDTEIWSLEGSIQRQDGYMSTTFKTEFDPADPTKGFQGFNKNSHPVRMTLRVARGTKVFKISDVSDFPREMEVVLGHGRDFRLGKFTPPTEENPFWNVDVDVL